MEYKVTSEDKILVGVELLSYLFDRDIRSVQLWAKHEGMPKEEHGIYDLLDCIRWRLKVLNDELENNKASAEERAVKLETQTLINQEKKLKFKKLLGELVDYDAVRIAWVSETKAFRKALNAMVPNLDSALDGVTDRHRRRIIIQEKVKDVLLQISENLKIENETENDEDLPEDLADGNEDIENYLGEE